MRIAAWSRRRKIWLGALAAMALLLVLNTVATDRETREASALGGRLVEVEGHEIHVREAGDPRRPSVVLLHGLAGSTRLWDRLTPLLDDRYRVISVDLLGHGGSDMPREGYALEDQAERIGSLMDRLRVRRPLVVGHSLGGMVGVALSERRPGSLRGLVAIGTPADEGDVDLRAGARLAARPVIGELLYRVTTDGMVEDALEDALWDGAPVPEQFVDDYRAMTFSAYAKSYREGDEFAAQAPLPERMARTRVPVLAVMGSEDEEVKPRALDAWRIQGAATHLLRGQGHTPQWQRPDTLFRVIRQFDVAVGR